MLLPIQTFWTNNNSAESWLSKEYHAYSWALSVYSLHTHLSGVTLHTTLQGADWLIGTLDLPYSQVILSLEDYQLPDERAWVMKKLHTYALQDEGFIHVDGDAYLFAPLSDSFANSPLLAQNLEFDHPYYIDAVKTIEEEFNYNQPYFESTTGQPIWAVNAGILGGQNIAFFKQLYNEAETFLVRNQADLYKLSSISLNTYLEQYMFKQLADANGLSISTMMPKPVGYPYTYGLDKFASLPVGVGYLHLMNYKQNPTSCEQLAQRLWLEAPHLYERCRKTAQREEQSKVYFYRQKDESILPRTFDILNSLNLATSPIAVDFIAEAISGIKEKQTKALVQDVWEFEMEKQEYLRQLPDSEILWADWRQVSQQVNYVFGQRQDFLKEQGIEHGAYCVRIGSEWNWADIAEFHGQKERNDFQSNWNKEPSYFEALVYPSLNLDAIREQLLDGISILLFDEVETLKPYYTLVDNITITIAQHQPKADERMIRQRVEDRLRSFLYLGVIRFCELEI